jgi:hypothetical protein
LFLSITGKWLELLKEATLRLERVAVIFDRQFPAAEIYVTSIEAAAITIVITTFGARFAASPTSSAPSMHSRPSRMGA